MTLAGGSVCGRRWVRGSGIVVEDRGKLVVLRKTVYRGRFVRSSNSYYAFNVNKATVMLAFRSLSNGYFVLLLAKAPCPCRLQCFSIWNLVLCAEAKSRLVALAVSMDCSYPHACLLFSGVKLVVDWGRGVVG